MKSNRWFCASGRHSNAHRRRIHLSVKSRRLAVERMEDRLLLAGGFQSGMEWHLEGSEGNGADCVILAGRPVVLDSDLCGVKLSSFDQGQYFSVDGADKLVPHGESAVCDFDSRRYMVTFADDRTGRFGAVAAQHRPAAEFKRLVGDNLPPAGPGQGMVDVGSVFEKSICVADEPALSRVTQTSRLAGAGQPAVATPEGVSSRPRVDGAQGRCQAFELAMATGWEFESGPAESANVLAMATGRELDSDAARSSDGLLIATGLPTTTGPAVFAADDPPIAKAAAKASLDEDVRVASSSMALVGGEKGSPSAHASPAERIVQSSATWQPGDFAPPAQSAAPTDASRQAVFADQADGADLADGAEAPAAVLDKARHADLAGLVVVAVAGRHLAREWRDRPRQSPTCLLPPRRRSS